MQHACGLGAALQQHYDAVMNSMSQLTLAKEEQMCESNALLEMFNKMTVEGKLGEQLKEIERLLNERQWSAFCFVMFTNFVLCP